jgi:hypothetical protein
MPLILKKLGADPVIASSIFLTTATKRGEHGIAAGSGRAAGEKS